MWLAKLNHYCFQAYASSRNYSMGYSNCSDILLTAANQKIVRFSKLPAYFVFNELNKLSLFPVTSRVASAKLYIFLLEMEKSSCLLHKKNLRSDRKPIAKFLIMLVQHHSAKSSGTN